MLTANARLDPISGEVYPSDTGQWDNVASTWDNFNTWYTAPVLPMVYLIDLDVEQRRWIYRTDYNLKIETDATGSVGYEVYTLDSSGAPLNTTVINPGDFNVPAFNGEYYMVAVVITATSGTPVLRNVSITASNQFITQWSKGVSTSTLGGTIAARPIVLNRIFGSISNITVDVRQVTPYAVDMYVSNYATSTTVIPRVVSMDRTAPTIALVGIDNSPQDAVVDLTITGLPMQYMNGNNLYLR